MSGPLNRLAVGAAGIALLLGGGLSACGSSTPSSTGASPVYTTPPLTTTRSRATNGPRTVNVQEYDIGFKLSKDTVPAGRITFRMVNTGAIIHNFNLVGVKKGPFLNSGGTASFVVTLKPGSYTYVCDVKEHANAGMQGTLVVTRVQQ